MDVSIIILGYNTKHHLKECLESVLKQELNKKFEIIYVDNASKDGSVEYVKNNFPKVRITRSRNNLGYAGGNNLGIQESCGNYIVILNPDTVVKTNWLQKLLKLLDSNPKIGIVMSKILLYGTPTKINTIGNKQNYLGFGWPGNYGSRDHFEKNMRIKFPSGVSIAIRKSLIKTIGLFDHCLPKDPWLLRYGVMKYGFYFREPEFISLGRRINDHMSAHIVELISDVFKNHHLEFRESVITILGVAYLEDSDDIRNTPAKHVISLLRSRNAEIRAHDPYIDELDGITIEKDIWKATNQSDCVVIITKHSQYYEIDLHRLKEIMRTPIIIDGRNVFTQESAKNIGFTYKGVGKGER